MVRSRGVTTVPSRSVTVTPSARTSTTRSSSMISILRVCSRKAGMSEAR
jgi:hypothetical protein